MISRLICVSVLMFSSYASYLQAADVVNDVARNNPQSSAYAAIGLAFSAYRIPLVGLSIDDEDIDNISKTNFEIPVVIEGRFQYKRFFAEIIDDSFSFATVGASVFDSESASLELIATGYFLTIERNGIEGYETIEDRHGDVSLGVRSSHFFSDSLVQFEVVADVAEHKGVVAAVHFGKQKQIRNWSLYGLGGVRYFSEEAVDHLLGVSVRESTEIISVYKPGAAVHASLQLGATLPLSEKWIFKAKAEYGKFSKAIANSPLAAGDDMFIASVGLNYILFN